MTAARDDGSPRTRSRSPRPRSKSPKEYGAPKSRKPRASLRDFVPLSRDILRAWSEEEKDGDTIIGASLHPAGVGAATDHEQRPTAATVTGGIAALRVVGGSAARDEELHPEFSSSLARGISTSSVPRFTQPSPATPHSDSENESAPIGPDSSTSTSGSVGATSSSSVTAAAVAERRRLVEERRRVNRSRVNAAAVDDGGVAAMQTCDSPVANSSEDSISPLSATFLEKSPRARFLERRSSSASLAAGSLAAFENDMALRQLKDAVFVGHINTDLDSVAGAIAGADLFGGVAAVSEENLNGINLFSCLRQGVSFFE